MLYWNMHALNNYCYDFVMTDTMALSVLIYLLPSVAFSIVSYLLFVHHVVFNFQITSYMAGWYVRGPLNVLGQALSKTKSPESVDSHANDNNQEQLQAMSKVARDNLGAEKTCYDKQA